MLECTGKLRTNPLVELGAQGMSVHCNLWLGCSGENWNVGTSPGVLETEFGLVGM